jgi:hypothetical protein
MTETSIEVLRRNLDHLQAGISWLQRSWAQCREIGIKETYTPEDYDKFENLTSRFARVVDILVNKVLRSIDAVELMEPGSIIDAANRAESRGLVESVSMLRDLKDLRNSISHEYETEDLADIFAAVLHATPQVLAVSDRVFAYCRTYTDVKS